MQPAIPTAHHHTTAGLQRQGWLLLVGEHVCGQPGGVVLHSTVFVPVAIDSFGFYRAGNLRAGWQRSSTVIAFG